jgi:hypothetical protein
MKALITNFNEVVTCSEEFELVNDTYYNVDEGVMYPRRGLTLVDVDRRVKTMEYILVNGALEINPNFVLPNAQYAVLKKENDDLKMLMADLIGGAI